MKYIKKRRSRDFQKRSRDKDFIFSYLTRNRRDLRVNRRETRLGPMKNFHLRSPQLTKDAICRKI